MGKYSRVTFTTLKLDSVLAKVVLYKAPYVGHGLENGLWNSRSWTQKNADETLVEFPKL